MTMEIRITENNLVSLTDFELEQLENILQTGDRGGFYTTYYAMTGNQAADLQARIATFSGPVGSVAFGANRLLQDAFGPGTSSAPEYPGIYYLSQQVALEALGQIQDDAEGAANGGNIGDEAFDDTAERAWQEASIIDYFPGNVFDITRIPSVIGSFFASLANYQNWDTDLLLNLIRTSSEPGVLVSALSIWVSPDYGKTSANMDGYTLVEGPGGFELRTNDDGIVAAALGIDTNDVLVTATRVVVDTLFTASGAAGIATAEVFKALIRQQILEPASGPASPSDFSEFSDATFNGDTQANSHFPYEGASTSAHWREAGTDEDDILYAASGSTDGGEGDDLVFGQDGAGDTLKGDEGDDILWGRAGSDTIEGGAGDDILRGGSGNDTLRPGSGEDVVEGGDITTTRSNDGTDTADYSLDDDGGRATLNIDVLLGDGQDFEKGVITVIDSGGSEDLLYSIERIIGTDKNDTVLINQLVKEQLERLEYIDGGDNDDGTVGDLIDAGEMGRGVKIDLRDTTNQTVQSANGSGPTLHLKNFESATGTSHDDTMLIRGSDGALFDAGAGNDTIISLGGILGEVDGGAGDDVFYIDTLGMRVYGGAGEDTFFFGQGVGIMDATGEDTFSFFGIEPHLALANVESESDWAYALGSLIKFGFNTAGEMVVGSSLFGDQDEDYMYFINANRDPLVPTEQLTAGIRVAALEFDVYQILEFPKPLMAMWEEGRFWELYDRVWEDLRSDPLVLDLDGDGIELSAESSVAPSFDVDGDLFAERTGWVRRDDGLLAVDYNGDGKINGVGELFGGPGVSGFSDLASFDTDGDGIIETVADLDANAAFDVSDLRIWQDLDQDGVTDAGELKTLAELDIVSIDLGSTAASQTVAGNEITDTSTFTRGNGSTGVIANVVFDANQHNTAYLGDVSIRTEIENLPNLKGFGTLPDLHVVLSRELDASDAVVANGGSASTPLADTLATVLPTLDVPDLDILRTRAMPILQAWAAAAPAQAGLAPNPDLVVLFDRSSGETAITDLVGLTTKLVWNPVSQAWEDSAPFWKRASGNPILDAQGNAIEFPTLQDVLAQNTGSSDLTWGYLTGEEIDFMERFTGTDVPAETLDMLDQDAIAPLSEFLGLSRSVAERMAVRLASEGGLAEYFADVVYEAGADSFVPTSERELAPMFEAIFADAPASEPGTVAWLQSWESILDVVLVDYVRSWGNGLNSYPFLLTNIVAAYENIGLEISLKQAGVALGIPEAMIKDGAGTLNGSTGVDLFYLGDGDQTAVGGVGSDSYIVGRDFGQDVINDNPGSGGSHDAIRFAHFTSDQLTFSRDGVDLVITVNGTSDSLRVVGQFHDVIVSGITFEGDASDKTEIEEIVFADGKVWVAAEIAEAVSHPHDHGEILTGTDQIDFMDGGLGNDLLKGGGKSDIYAFGTGYGFDVIQEGGPFDYQSTHPDFLRFGSGIEVSDVSFERIGVDLVVRLQGTQDTLVIRDQFSFMEASFVPENWTGQVEGFVFENGSSIMASHIRADLVTGSATNGNDVIFGFQDDGDVYRGGAGDDIYFVGAFNYQIGGNDILEFSTGDGFDILRGSEGDVIRLGAGISSTDVSLRTLGEYAVLSIAGTDDHIVIDRDFYDEAIELNRVEFADGSNLSAAQLDLAATELQYLQYAEIVGNTSFYDFDLGTQSGYLYGSEGGVIRLHNVDADDISVVFNFDRATDDILADAYLYANNGTGNFLALLAFSTDISQIVFDDSTVWDTQYVLENFFNRSGGSGDDVVSGGRTGDNISFGQGNDQVHGGEGSDSYIFSDGDGFDHIFDRKAVGSYGDDDDTLTFDDVDASDITFLRPIDRPQDLVIFVNGTEQGQVTVVDQFGGVDGTIQTEDAIDRIYFADGTLLTVQALQNRLLEEGSTEGDDWIYGFGDADTISGGLGDDTLVGFRGVDTYLWSTGEGNDVIQDRGFDPEIAGEFNEYDRLILDGVMPDDVAARIISTSSTTFDVEITITIGSEVSRLLLSGQGERFGGPNTIERIIFDDGTIWTDADLARLAKGAYGTTPTIVGTAGYDELMGTRGDDVFDGGAGDDAFSSEFGNDLFLWRAGSGNDLIMSSNIANADTVLLEDIDIGDVNFVKGLTGGVYYVGIQLAATGEVLRLSHEVDWELGADFVVFDNGDSLNTRELLRLGAGSNATSGNDNLVASADGEVFAGLAGDDVLTGNDWKNTYLWRAGDGNDVLVDEQTRNEYVLDKLLISAVNAADVSVQRSGDDLVLVMGPGGETITLTNQSLGSGRGVEYVLFDDGTQWSRADLQRLAPIEASPGGEVVNVYSDELTVLLSGGGNDSFVTRGGNIEYRYQSGDGNDVVDHDSYTTVDNRDVAIFEDLLREDLEFFRVGDDLIVYATATQAIIRFVDQLIDDSDGVDEIRFANGEFWYAERIIDAAQDAPVPEVLWTGTLGGDELLGSEFDDRIIGGAGDDLLSAGGGNDVYVFAIGDGNDAIEDDSNSAFDALRISGYLTSDVLLGRSGADLLITFVGNPGDSITIGDGLLQNGSNVIESIVFDDTSSWTIADIAASLGGWTTGEVVTDYIDYTSGSGLKTYIVDISSQEVPSPIPIYLQDLDYSEGELTFLFDANNGNAFTILFASNPNDKIVLANVVDYQLLTELVVGVAFVDTETYISVDEMFEPVALVGTSGDDVLTATAMPHHIEGLGGNDELYGGSANDLLEGGDGDDLYDGGAGYDLNSDASGSDTYIYRAGGGPDDIHDSGTANGESDILRFVDLDLADIEISASDTYLVIWTGEDELWIIDQFIEGTGEGLIGIERIEFSDNSWLDRAQIYDLAHPAGLTFYGTGADEIFDGAGGDDVFNTGGDGGFDQFNGLNGFDRITGSASADIIRVAADMTNLDSIEEIDGGDGIDWIVGTSGDDYLDFYAISLISIENFDGGAGNDYIGGSILADWIDGGVGDDYVFGWAGDDILVGGVGADSFDGGDGTDTASYETSASGVSVHMLDWEQNTGDAYGDIYYGIENLTGSAHNDSLIATDEANVVSGGAGDDVLLGLLDNDTLLGGEGSDVLHGGDGNDTLHGDADNDELFGDEGDDELYGNDGDDYFVAGAGNDALDGGAGVDELHGGDGNDSIAGGIGADSLFGDIGDDTLDGGADDDYLLAGDGDDTILFRPGYGSDFVSGFVAGAASDDVIELSGFEVDTFSELQGLMAEWGGNTFLTFGDGSELILESVGVAQLHADDFRFV